MRILNVRLGLATNSSSTHSLIFLPKGASAGEVSTDGPQEYGWDYFQLTTPETKLDYLAQSLFQQLKGEMGEEIARTVAREWSGSCPIVDGYVDHQSAYTFPRGWDGKGIDRDFFNDFKTFLLRDDIVVAGGNDNDEGELPVLSTGGVRKFETNNLPTESYSAPWVARKDGDYWTLFNRHNGAKIRMTFKGEEFDVIPQRSTAPELVDIKITDYCPFACSYCYQDSTLEGKHASDGWLTALAYQLAGLNVFEVAIGGGEPTLHPKFVDILQAFRRCNIVPNFTTKNLGWLKGGEQTEEILKLAGAFAFSAEKAGAVHELAALLERRGIDHRPYVSNYRPVTIQHVVGVSDEAEFQEVLLACRAHDFQITLLGYKMVGRGPEFGVKPSSKWLTIVKKVCEGGYLRVGIDTALADRHWDDLIAVGVPAVCMTRVEGQFSCYIDAVAQTINTSSYTVLPGVNIGVHPSTAQIRDLYQLLSGC
jgi:hypothetical protein